MYYVAQSQLVKCLSYNDNRYITHASYYTDRFRADFFYIDGKTKNIRLEINSCLRGGLFSLKSLYYS